MLILASGKPWLCGIAPDYMHFQQQTQPPPEPPQPQSLSAEPTSMITARERRSMLRELPQLFALAPPPPVGGSDATDGDGDGERVHYTLRSTQPLAASGRYLRGDLCGLKSNPFAGSPVGGPLLRSVSSARAHSERFASSRSSHESSYSASTDKQVTTALLDYRISSAVGSELVSAMHQIYSVYMSS